MIPLVLLAGMNCTAALWQGCGLDDALTPALDQPSMDAQVAALLARLPETFILGGQSLGGIVAMALAAAAPERVRGLLLVSTNAKAPTSAQQDSWGVWIDRIDAGVTPGTLQAGIIDLLLSPRALADPALVARAVAMGDATSPATLRTQLSMQTTRTDLRERLGGVPVPALVVAGAQDALCPPSFHTEIAERLPHARAVTLDGGHLLPLERPSAFGELVDGWRARLS
ncbi:alpha/beta hydrolase [Planococcus sp. APC 4015]|nr:alpha/beta hydrolase [Planococcus sp. APC 4015]